ncbi:hypothetical protein GCM10009730_16980 [Streptomyces albidochromogenes]|uniref:pyroglutamyl-peptidase I family protein n=1 Tax=Streptomyces albidochromogenes TaxID=329524 RepID=UPI002FE84465
MSPIRPARPTRPRAAALGVALLALAPLLGALPPAAAASARAAAPAPATVEEQRLERAVPQEILRSSGFDALAADFGQALGGARSYAAAERAVVRHGAGLWRRAVDRAQGRGPEGRAALPPKGDDGRAELSREDDRPLYWARLAMTRELRRWQAPFALPDAARSKLLDRLERSSRGQDSIRFPAAGAGGGKGVKRVLVTGFDPFTLDRDVRISNPSGATALALDGTVVRTADGPARIETAVFPVLWRDFADGTVERALRPHLPHLDLFTTVSQGRVGRIDVERHNGAWRGGFGDNENVSSTGTVPVDDPASQPQWTTTTLPYREITAADTGRFPVYDNTSVTEVPAGASAPVVRPDGPTPGSAARAGGGGDYLSNEIAYRATLLRDRLGLPALPGGHVHTPVLQFGAGNTSEVSDPEFVRNRQDIVAQIRAIVTVAGGRR